MSSRRHASHPPTSPASPASPASRDGRADADGRADPAARTATVDRTTTPVATPAAGSAAGAAVSPVDAVGDATGVASPPTPPPSSGPTIQPRRGRERQWALLLRALDAARSGPRRGAVLLVEGAPGTGRSRILADATAVAGAAGFSVAPAAADAVRRALPLAPLLAALPDDSAPPPPGEPDACGSTGTVDQLRARLTERLRSGPVLVALDDLHWADDVTLAALRTLVAGSVARPVVWLLARRPTESGSTADRLFTDLAAADRAERLRLGPLPDRAVAELITDRLAAEPARDLLDYVAGAGGNPAALGALLDGLTEEHRLQVADGRAHLVETPVPAGPPRRFNALVRRRVAALQPHTRLLLDVASVLGRTSTPDDMARMLGQPTATVLPALQEALAADVVVCEDDTVAFPHELLRQALLATLPGPLRGALHRQAAEMILSRDGGVVPAAAHLVHGARRGDARAVAVLGSAAAEVAATEPGTAVELACRALEITGPTDPARPDLIGVALEALTRSGPLPQAVTLVEEALAGPLPPQRATALRHGLSTVLLLAGRPTEAVAMAETALRDPDPAPDGDLRERAILSRLHGLAALDVTAAVREVRTESARRDGTDSAHRDGTESTRCDGTESTRRDGGATAGPLGALAVAHWRSGRIGEALRLAHRAAGGTDGPGVCWPFASGLTLATMLTLLRETDQAGALLKTLGDDIEAEGWPVLRGPATVLDAHLALARGALDTASSQAASGLAAAREAGLAWCVPLAWRVLVEVALRRGDLAAADEYAQRFAEAVTGPGAREAAGTARSAGTPRTAGTPGMPGTPWDGPDGDAARVSAAWAAAQLAAARGQTEELETALSVVHADEVALRRLFTEEPAAAAWLVHAARDQGRPERADQAVRLAEQLAAAGAEAPSPQAAAAHARGVHERDPEALRHAAEHHLDPWARASAAEDLGTLPDRDRANAVPELERAMAGYARLGAERDAARIRRRLRRLGVRRRHWTHADRPTTGWASLTETERRVAELVAQGLTNRQVAVQMFLSPHTIGFHLRQIFRKLRIQSRIDLVRMHPGTADGPRGVA